MVPGARRGDVEQADALGVVVQLLLLPDGVEGPEGGPVAAVLRADRDRDRVRVAVDQRR